MNCLAGFECSFKRDLRKSQYVMTVIGYKLGFIEENENFLCANSTSIEECKCLECVKPLDFPINWSTIDTFKSRD